MLKKEGRLTSKSIAASLGLTQQQVQRLLANLKASGRIVHHGSSKKGSGR